MLENLGDCHVLVLRNHGIAVCEQDVPRTFMRLWTAQRAAEIQCQADMLQGPNIMLNDGVRTRCSNLARAGHTILLPCLGHRVSYGACIARCTSSAYWMSRIG